MGRTCSEVTAYREIPGQGAGDGGGCLQSGIAWHSIDTTASGIKGGGGTVCKLGRFNSYSENHISFIL